MYKGLNSDKIISRGKLWKLVQMQSLKVFLGMNRQLITIWSSCNMYEEKQAVETPH